MQVQQLVVAATRQDRHSTKVRAAWGGVGVGALACRWRPSRPPACLPACMAWSRPLTPAGHPDAAG